MNISKLDKQIEEILGIHRSAYLSGLTFPAVSQIKQSILKAIIELHKRKCGEEGFELGYLRLEDLVNLLSEAKK